MPVKRFEGPCTLCGKTEPQGYYTNKMCKNCDRKEKRRKRGLKKSGVDPYLGPCIVCGTYESSNGRFSNKMCRSCYKRMNNSGNPTPRTKYIGPCVRCDESDPSLKYTRKMCPRCYKNYRNTVHGDSRRRRFSKALVVDTLTEEQWKRVLEFYKYTCAYCGKDIRDCYTMDHVIPISKRGPNSIDNVVPACLSCNSGKRDRKPPKAVVVLLRDGGTKLML